MIKEKKRRGGDVKRRKDEARKAQLTGDVDTHSMPSKKYESDIQEDSGPENGFSKRVANGGAESRAGPKPLSAKGEGLLSLKNDEQENGDMEEEDVKFGG